MDEEEIERLVVSVRADTAGFARDVAEMRGQVEGGLGAGADRAGRALETALGRALRSGKFGFEDLKRTALAVLSEIAVASVRGAIGGGGQGGLLSAGAALVSSLLGAPGRATGGPVAPGAAYRVGERGPELFVPTSSGTVMPMSGGGGGRDVRVAITINGGGGGEGARALARSGRQVARAVRAALDAS